MSTESEPQIPPEVAAFLDAAVGEGWSAAALHGDASVRSYFRISTAAGESRILACYPESIREGKDRFSAAYDALRASVGVPAVLGACEAAVLQEDVGDLTLFDIVRSDPPRGRELYRLAVDALVELQRAPTAASEINPPFDAAKFLEELEMTREWYVERLAGQHDEGAHRRLRAIFEQIAASLIRHPYVVCHRDYHGQNIHVINSNLYLIDYQDIRMGPDTYDLASLLRDRGAWQALGRDAEESLVGYYRERSGAKGEVDRRYWETLLERSIKAIGTFARQALSRERRHYLDFIPPTLESVREAAAHLDDYRDLAEVFPAGGAALGNQSFTG
jgi:N-acetylmuramate 1-kinase